MPKGTVGHHVKVLERAGLVSVVRTRQVRAVTEKYYGRVARLFLISATTRATRTRSCTASARRPCARRPHELAAAGGSSRCRRSCATRLSAADERRFDRRLERLIDDFRTSEDPDGEPMGLAIALYRVAGADA